MRVSHFGLLAPATPTRNRAPVNERSSRPIVRAEAGPRIGTKIGVKIETKAGIGNGMEWPDAIAYDYWQHPHAACVLVHLRSSQSISQRVPWSVFPLFDPLCRSRAHTVFTPASKMVCDVCRLATRCNT